MNSRSRLRCAAAGLCAALSLSAAIPAAQAADRPNFVIILADDLGYGDLGCFNRDSKIPTPNLDRLASQGMRFTDAHTPSGVCTPTRYGLLTGRYAWRTRLKTGVLGPWGAPLIEPDRLTMPAMIRDQGYDTACIGKWHLGWAWPTKDGKPPSSVLNRLSNIDFAKSIADGPTTRGFRSYFGVDLPNFPPYIFIENDRTAGSPSAPSTAVFNHPGPMLPGWDWTDIMPELAKRAASYIETAAKPPKQPFLLYLPLSAPHFPVVPSPEFRGKSGAGDFGDFVVQVDDAVGKVLDALDRSGAANDTCVIFTSDNGPEITGEVAVGAYDRIRKYNHRSMGPLRGAKRDVWEGGHRVPFLARWPKTIPAGTVSGETIGLIDVMATVAEIAGIPLPDREAEDSWSFLPALRGGKSSRPADEGLVMHGANGAFGIRQGDWVFIDAKTGQSNGARSGEPLWFRQERGYKAHDQPGELYDLGQDLAQKRNLYAEKPEIAGRLKALLNRYRNSGRSRPASASQAAKVEAKAKTNANAQSPNVLMFLVDDLGYMDIGANNPKTFYETPNIDRLAASGMRFTSGYAACPVCSPTRAAIQTGKSPPRTGVTDYIGAAQPEKWMRPTKMLPASYRDRLALEETTIAETFKASGHSTFFAGKWHLGPEGFWPENQGYDINQGGIDRGGPYGGSKYFSPYGNPKLKDGPPGEHLPDRLATETARFLEAQAQSGRPFFALLSFYDVHTPLMTRDDLRKKYEAKAKTSKTDGPEWDREGERQVRLVQNHAVYAGMVEAMDQAVGKVLDALKRLNLDQNTIVIFTSDNGGLSTSEGHPTSNVPLRAGKGWLYEGGIRVPWIVRAPGITKPGAVCDAPIASADLYPTLLELQGQPTNPRKLDGESFAPLLADPDRRWDRGPIFWHYPHYGNQGGAPGSAIRDGDWKLIEWHEDGRVELFNLRDDLSETRDLSQRHPETTRGLQAKLNAWRSETGALMPKPKARTRTRTRTKPQTETEPTRS